MSFETDLQKVRNEGRGLDWCGFLKLDADKAIKPKELQEFRAEN